MEHVRSTQNSVTCIEDTAQAFFKEYLETVETIFLNRVRGTDAVQPVAIRYLDQFLGLRAQAMQDVEDVSLTLQQRDRRAQERRAQYEAWYDELDAKPEIRQQVIELQAKLQDVASMARKQAAAKVLKAEHGEDGASADDITYTLHHFRRQGVDAVHVQRYLDELAAKMSLTSHPTNSTSVEHTKAAVALERALANPAVGKQAIEDALDAFIKAPVAAERKTPIEELEELIPIMDNLFDAALLQRDATRQALETSGYAAEGVAIRSPMLELEDWSSGFDGDGNANATREMLELGVARKQAWIAGRYTALLQEVKEHHRAQEETIDGMITKLSDHSYPDRQALLNDLEALQQTLTEPDAGVEDLRYLVATFGLYGSKGNLRHQAKTLHETIGLLLRLAGETEEAALFEAAFNKDAMSELLTLWFSEEPPQKLDHLKTALQQAAPEQLRALAGEDDTPVRILERLQFLAEHPDSANKFIIAEATHPADAKAAMVLMDITGNQVANKQAKQEIVMLVESVEDVRALPETIKQLAFDPVYQKHLEAMGRITVMIAHSDNRRRDGYSAGEVITKIEGEIARLQTELWEMAVREDCQPLLNMADEHGIPIYIFDGGGNDLMRGAAVNPGQTGKQHGHAAARENASSIRTPQNTIQGEQNRLLFGYPDSAAMFLEMMVSQTMYAKAAVEKLIGSLVPDADYVQAQRQAQRSSVLFHDTARKAFHDYTDPEEGKVNPFDALFSHSGAWVSTLLANRSSRSNQRGKDDGDVMKTVEEIQGNRTALSQRAITGNLLFQLTGTFHLGLLGQLEALEEIGKEKAHQMFHSSLPDRTHLVGAAQQLMMTDFGKAWRMMGEERPDRETLRQLAVQFDDKCAQKEMPTPKETLAFMEDYGLRLAEYIYYAARGVDVEQDFDDPNRPFEIRDAYCVMLPELAHQHALRHASHEAENAALVRMERLFSEHPQQQVLPAMEMTAVALVGGLNSDIRPALGPVAVRGAKGVATTDAERNIGAGEVPPPDMLQDLQQEASSGISSPFSRVVNMGDLHIPKTLSEL